MLYLLSCLPIISDWDLSIKKSQISLKIVISLTVFTTVEIARFFSALMLLGRQQEGHLVC